MTETHLRKISVFSPEASKISEVLEPVLVAHGFELEMNGNVTQAGDLVFLDVRDPHYSKKLSSLDRKGRAIFLIVPDSMQEALWKEREFPRELLEGTVDDVLVSPFRPYEVMSCLKHFQQILLWDEVKTVNSSFEQLIESLRGDLEVAQRLQKSRHPKRFPDFKGLKFQSRYLAGMKSGGDFFDIGESKNGKALSMVLTDSSSHGLSSAVLGALSRLARKLSLEDTRTCHELFNLLSEDLTQVMGDRDELSFFYSVVTRDDLKLRYINVGTSELFHARKGKPFQRLGVHADPMGKKKQRSGIEEAVVELRPEDRLILLSDGFVESTGGRKGLEELLSASRSQDPIDQLNELAYQVKKHLQDDDDLPEQDCTAIIMDVDAGILRKVS